MVPDRKKSGRTDGRKDGRNGQTDAAKTISLRLRRGIISQGQLRVSLRNFETIRGSLMKPKWQKLASLAQEICKL